MLSNQILHKTVQDIKNITGLECGVWDMNAKCLVMSSERMLGLEKEVASFCRKIQEEPEQADEEAGLYLVCDDDEPAYILALMGNSPQISMAGKMGASQLANLLYASKERMDKNRFIQNLILDNMLLVDVYNQAKKMKIPTELKRTVFLIEAKNEGESLILETLKGLYATGTKDFVTAVDERHVILVKALESTDGYEQLNQIAKVLVDTLNMDCLLYTSRCV